MLPLPDHSDRPSLLARLLNRVPLAVDSHALWQLLQPARAGEAPVRVLVLEPRLARAVQWAGCTVVTSPPSATSPGSPFGPDSEPINALCAFYVQAQRRKNASPPSAAQGLIDILAEHAQRVRPGGVVVLCTRAKLPRARLCAAFLHAGLTEISQVQTGRYVLTAGRTLPPLL